MLRLLVNKCCNRLFVNLRQQNFYATIAVTTPFSKKKKLAKMGAIVEKKVHPVETDANKLVKFVCGSNILKNGQDIEIKPDSEYPDWLWELNTGKPKTLEEMDKNSKEYWIKVRKMAIVQHHKVKKLRKW